MIFVCALGHSSWYMLRSGIYHTTSKHFILKANISKHKDLRLPRATEVLDVLKCSYVAMYKVICFKVVVQLKVSLKVQGGGAVL